MAESDRILERAILDAVDRRFQQQGRLGETKRDHFVSILRHVAEILQLPLPCQLETQLQQLFGRSFHPSQTASHLDQYLRENTIGKERLIKTRDVFIVLGIDGFHGLVDLKPYLETSSSRHFQAVQNMYRAIDALPIASLTGTDSACVVFLALLKLFQSGPIVDDQVLLLVDRILHKVSSFMYRHAYYYQDIRLVNDDLLAHLARTYCETNPDWSKDAIQRSNLLLKLNLHKVVTR